MTLTSAGGSDIFVAKLGESAGGENWNITWTPPDPPLAKMHTEYEIGLTSTNLSGTTQTFNYGLSENRQFLNPAGLPFTPNWDVSELVSTRVDNAFYSFGLEKQETISSGASQNHTFSVSRGWNWIEPFSLSRYIFMAANFLPSNGALLKTLSTSGEFLGAITTFADIIASAPQARCTYTGLLDAQVPPFQITVLVPKEKMSALIASIFLDPAAAACSSAGMNVGAAIGWTSWGLIPAGGLLLGEAYMLASSENLYNQAVDPDDNFMIIATPELVVEPALATIPPSPEKITAELAIELFSVTKAAATSYARYLGAISAGDSEWAAKQLAASNLYISQAQLLINEMRTLSQDIVSQYPTPGPGDIAAIRNFLTTQGLPSIEADALGRLGYAEEEISDLTTTMISFDDSYFTNFVNLPQALEDASFELAILTNNLPEPPGGIQVPLPTADAGLDKEICIGESITIGGNPTAKGGTPPYSFSWTPITGLSDPTVSNPTARPTSTTKYWVRVTDANGLSAMDIVTVKVHEYVFLSDDYVKINKNKASDGNIHSNQKIEFGVGAPGTHTGNLTALGDITIRNKNTITGNVTAGDEFYLFGSASVTGTKIDHVTLSPIPLPNISFKAGKRNVTVPINGSRTLAPGSYGRVSVRNKATLFLSAGNFFIDVLDTDPSSKLSINVSDGPVNIHVVNDLDFATKVQVLITGTEATTDKVSFITLQDSKLDIGQYTTIRGAIIAQNAEVHFSKGCRFKGSVCADGITLDPDVKFQFHNSTAPFLKEAEDDEETANEEIAAIVTNYELAQNYPNPFNPSTMISFALPEVGKVTVNVYNATGQFIRTLVDREMPAGRQTVRWNGRDQSGQLVAAGVYLYQIVVQRENGETAFSETRRMTLLK